MLAALAGGAGSTRAATPATHARGETSAARGELVARIGTATISRVALDHWLTVANDTSQTQTGAKAQPLPLPPDYRACVRDDEHRAGNTAPSRSAARLAADRAACASRHEQLVTEVLNFLIPEMWIQGEAADLGIAVTRTEIDAGFAQERLSAVPSLATRGALDKFMAASGQTVLDLRWRTRIELLANRIELRKGRNQRKLDRQLTTTWMPRTQCRRGYAVADCGTMAFAAAPQGPWVPVTAHIVPPPSRRQRLRFTPSGG